MSSENRTSFLRKIRGSLICAGVLLGVDIVVYGSFLFSMFVGPIWLLIAIARAIMHRRDWRLSVTRVVIPLVTLALVVGNAFLQSGIARANAERIITACTQYRASNGVYPKTMDVLVPKYLDSVPRAKYALVLGEFSYSELDGQHSLMWVSTPPFGRPYYNFERARWGYLD
jgi:hypothetical protein